MNLTFSALLRAKFGMPMIYFADECGLSRQQVYNLCAGKVNPDRVTYATCHSIACALHVPAHEVFEAIQNTWRNAESMR